MLKDEQRFTQDEALVIVQGISELMEAQLEKMYNTKIKLNNAPEGITKTAFENELKKQTAHYEYLDKVRGNVVEVLKNQLDMLGR